MTTFTHGESKIAIKGGKIIESNYARFPVGMAMTVARFNPYGWNKVKPVRQYYAKGLTSGRTFRD